METCGSDTFLKRIERVLFLWGMPLSFLGFMLPVFGGSVGSSPLQIGLLYTAFSAMTIFARPLIGHLSDRHGRKRYMVAGVVLYAAAMGLLAVARGFAPIVAARALQGLASALFWLVMNASIADVSAPELRARNFGMVSAASVRGQLVGAFVGFSVLFSYLGFVKGAMEADGLRASFAVFACILFAASVYAAARLPDTREAARKPDGPAIPFKLDRRWAVVLAASFSSACAGSLIAPLVMILLRERYRAPVNVIALAYIPMGLVWAFTPKYCARFVTRFGRLPVMAVSLMAAAASTAFIPFAPALWLLACLWAVSAMFDVAGNIAEQSYIADLSPREHGGKGYGLYIMVNDIGAATGPLVGTLLYGLADWLAFAAAALLFLATGIFVAIAGARAASR